MHTGNKMLVMVSATCHRQSGSLAKVSTFNRDTHTWPPHPLTLVHCYYDTIGRAETLSVPLGHGHNCKAVKGKEVYQFLAAYRPKAYGSLWSKSQVWALGWCPPTEGTHRAPPWSAGGHGRALPIILGCLALWEGEDFQVKKRLWELAVLGKPPPPIPWSLHVHLQSPGHC